jgi:signal transduction histidine kinase
MASGGAVKPSVLSLDEVVMDVLAFLSHEFQTRGVRVSLDLARDLPGVLGDRTQLQQVVVNLAMNAIQALRSNSVTKAIVIRTQRKNAKTICCIVEDSGPGFDLEHLPRLFDKFFTMREAGMGLGLAIVQSIIEMHGGVIQADNGSSLGGARFIFELPVSSALED